MQRRLVNKHKENVVVRMSNCLYRSFINAVNVKTIYYSTDAQIYIIRRYNYNYCKIFKIAPTCFGSQGIHHQGALYSAWLKLK